MVPLAFMQDEEQERPIGVNEAMQQAALAMQHNRKAMEALVQVSRMVGGNLEGETRVLTTGILMYTQMGRFEEAIALAVLLLGLTFVLAATLTAIQQARRT